MTAHRTSTRGVALGLALLLACGASFADKPEWAGKGNGNGKNKGESHGQMEQGQSYRGGKANKNERVDDVRIGGFSINADDSGDTVDISSSDESISIQAHDDAAEIRTRAPGEATRRTYMLTDRTPADTGWRLVGFEARGPVGGPIIIATVRARDRDSDGVFDSAKDLVTLNVGE